MIKIFQWTVVPKGHVEENGGYVGINDPGHDGYSRNLSIDDGRGGKAHLKDEEIGQLYKAIKPALAG